MYTDAAEPVTAKVLHTWMVKAQAEAQVRATGGIHILRHTFCSHLAMRGAPALSIQRLVGHHNLSTTYIHLVKREIERAIIPVEQAHPQTDTTEASRTHVFLGSATNWSVAWAGQQRVNGAAPWS